MSCLSEVSHPWRYAPPWWPPSVLSILAGRTGEQACWGERVEQARREEKPVGENGRTYPSGIASVGQELDVAVVRRRKVVSRDSESRYKN